MIRSHSDSDAAPSARAYARKKSDGIGHRVRDEIHDALTDTADDLDGRLPAGPGYHRAVMLVVVAAGFFMLGRAWPRGG